MIDIQEVMQDNNLSIADAVMKEYDKRIQVAIDNRNLEWNVFSELIKLKSELKIESINKRIRMDLEHHDLKEIEINIANGIAAAEDKDGKKIYTNDSKRKAALLAALPINKKYQDALKSIADIKSNLNEIDLGLSIVRSYAGFIQNKN